MDTKMMQQLRAAGVDIQSETAGNEESKKEGMSEYITELHRFLEGIDFLKTGQAVNRGQWESAAMCVRRLQQNAERLGVNCFQRTLTGLRQAVLRKNKSEAKQLLALIVQKRVQLRGILNMGIEENTKNGR